MILERDISGWYASWQQDSYDQDSPYFSTDPPISGWGKRFRKRVKKAVKSVADPRKLVRRMVKAPLRGARALAKGAKRIKPLRRLGNRADRFYTKAERAGETYGQALASTAASVAAPQLAGPIRLMQAGQDYVRDRMDNNQSPPTQLTDTSVPYEGTSPTDRGNHTTDRTPAPRTMPLLLLAGAAGVLYFLNRRS